MQKKKSRNESDFHIEITSGAANGTGVVGPIRALWVWDNNANASVRAFISFLSSFRRARPTMYRYRHQTLLLDLVKSDRHRA
jgi:hypothetical protein